jgi:chromate reductase
MNSPEAYIQFTKGLIDEAGNVSDDSVREFLTKYMVRFYEFIDMVVPCLTSSRN